MSIRVRYSILMCLLLMIVFAVAGLSGCPSKPTDTGNEGEDELVSTEGEAPTEGESGQQPAQVSLVLDKTSVTVPENGTANFQVKLSVQPSSDVTVSVSRASGDTDITVQSGASLTFTTSNWSTYQPATLAAAHDPDTTNGTATIRCGASGLASVDVAATELDDDSNSGPVLVTFPDPGLDAAVRAAIGKPTGSIYTTDLVGKGFTMLLGSGVSNLAGIEYCTDLTVLSLPRSQISDISALSSLTSLTSLYLSENQISDISALSSLAGLYNLDFRHNQISNVSALSGLADLTNLNLSENQISDISALSSLTSLMQLNLWDNQISDISALSSLTTLTTLYLWGNQISDISALSSLTGLAELHLRDNQISDISALSGLVELWFLDLSNNQISDISGLVANSRTDRASVILSGNPLSQTALNTDIPALQARGWDLAW